MARGQRKPLLAMTAEAALLRLPPPAAWEAAILTLPVGCSVSEDELKTFLQQTGYAIEPHVQGPCEHPSQAAPRTFSLLARSVHSG